MNMHGIYFHSFKKDSEKEYYLKWKMQKNILARNETMLLLHWPEPEAAGEQGVWQWCDIMTSNSPCGWKVCLLPPVTRGIKRERLRERERKLAGKRVHVRGWERQRSGERECAQREGEGLTERNWQASVCPCEREGGCKRARMKITEYLKHPSN